MRPATPLPMTAMRRLPAAPQFRRGVRRSGRFRRLHSLLGSVTIFAPLLNICRCWIPRAIRSRRGHGWVGIFSCTEAAGVRWAGGQSRHLKTLLEVTRLGSFAAAASTARLHGLGRFPADVRPGTGHRRGTFPALGEQRRSHRGRHRDDPARRQGPHRHRGADGRRVQDPRHAPARNCGWASSPALPRTCCRRS